MVMNSAVATAAAALRSSYVTQAGKQAGAHDIAYDKRHDHSILIASK